MKKIVAISLFFAVFCSVQSAFAWGKWAHEFITYTVEKHLEPEVKSKIEKYFGSSMIDHPKSCGMYSSYPHT